MLKEDIQKLSEINPELKAWIDIFGAPKKLPHSVDKARVGYAKIEKTLLKLHPSMYEGVVVEDSTVKARDGYEIPIRSFKPTTPASDGCPLVLAIHGGGYMIGSMSFEEKNCVEFVKNTGVVAVSLDYRLAPEYKFPYAVDDCWDVVQYLAKNAASFLPVNFSKGFIVEGGSAGGNLADVVGHLARDDGLEPPITGLLEVIPSVCDFDHIPSRWQDMHISHEQNAVNPGLCRDTMEWMRENYAPDSTSTLYSPFLDPKNHEGMPPVFIQVSGLDPLRDQGIIYHEALKEVGIKTKLKIYPGLPHAFHMNFRRFEISRQHDIDTVDGLRWLLNGGQD